MAPPPPPPPSQKPLVVAGGGHRQQRASLYVGDLDPEVTERELWDKFQEIGPVASVHLCRCAFSGKSLRYAYANFYSHFQASKALACLNHSFLKGRPMRIMWSQRDPFPRKSGIANIFVKNLDPSINSLRLQNIFCQFGSILSCKVAEENGKSKGFGFVHFDSEESAIAARAALHDTMLQGKKLFVSKFVKKSNRTAACEELKYTNLYVKNLVEDMTEDLLRDMFSVHGKVCNAVIMKDQEGKSRGFGFVNFQSPEEAKRAVEALNGVLLGSKTLYVGRAQKKAERAEILKREYKGSFSCHIEKAKVSNLYVKNLNVYVDDNKLQELFSIFGRITSAKVMRHNNGISKGFGFVCFSTPEEAKKAMDSLNRTTFEGRTLYVAIAQRKEDRYRASQNYYVQYPPQSLYSYPYNCNAIPPQFQPLYYNTLQYPPAVPFLHQPMLYQQSGTDVSVHYPFATPDYQQNFSSCIPLRQTHLMNSGNTKDWVYRPHAMTYANSYVRTRELSHGNPGVRKVGFWMKGNKKSGPEESSYELAATGGLAAVTSPGSSKKTIENLLLVENIQPDCAKIKEMLFDPKNCDCNM